jgi:hydroxyacylglutathione hydrolase
MLKMELLTVGPLATNSYLLGGEDAGGIVIIDPGGEAQSLLRKAEEMAGPVAALLLTHGHVDHIAACAELIRATGAKLYVHSGDAELVRKPDAYWASLVGGCEACEPDVAVADGDRLHLAGLELTVLHTPGHSPGGVCYLTDNVCFCGDTLFAGSIGRTDLPLGDEQAMEASLARMLSELPDEMDIFPGHGPATTMAAEKKTNPFLQDLPTA